MKSVAIVYHYFAHYRKPILEELMNSKKIDFTIISGEESEIPIEKIDLKLASKTIDDQGWKWLIVKNIWFLKKFLWQMGLIKIMINSKFDAVIFLGNPYFISTWISILICKLKRVDVYFWMHGFYKDKITLIDFIKIKIFYKMATGLFLYGHRAYTTLLRLGIKKADEMFVVYNSLDYNLGILYRQQFNETEIREFRHLHFGSNHLPTICFIGRLNKIKRIDLLIEVQKRYLREHGSPLFNALIIGGGEELDELKKMVSKDLTLNKKSIKFLGPVYDEAKIANLITLSDLCVTPGEVGLTAMHSLTYGTPVISHDNLNIQMPEVEAIKPGITGDLYKYNNVDSLKKTIENWLIQYPIKTDSLIEDCYNVIDKIYNPHIQREIFEQVLNKSSS